MNYTIKHFVLLGVLLNLTSLTQAQFYDTAEFPTWATEAIYDVNEAEIMMGYGDRTFRPDEKLTRAEMVTLLLRAKNVNETDVDYDGQSKFPDVVENSWYAPALVYAEDLGWVKGHPDGNFYPGNNLTRAEFVTFIARAFDLSDTYNPEVITFEDVNSNDWYASSLAGLYDRGLLRNARNRIYRPGNIVTRAEAAWTFAEILKKPGIHSPKEINLENNQSRYAGSSTRVAIKPRNFNPEKQSVEVEKDELYIYAEASQERVVMTPSQSDFILMGNLRIDNRFDYTGELETVEISVRITENAVGPVDEFEARLIGPEYEKDIVVNKSGEAIFTGLSMTFDANEEKVFKFYMRPKADANFYKKNGSATVYVNRIEGLTYKPYISSSRIADLRSAPTGYGDRQLASIELEVIEQE